jgi:hypothetical protein
MMALAPLLANPATLATLSSLVPSLLSFAGNPKNMEMMKNMSGGMGHDSSKFETQIRNAIVKHQQVLKNLIQNIKALKQHEQKLKKITIKLKKGQSLDSAEIAFLEAVS